MSNYQHLVIMDVETGGLDEKKNPITQVGLLALDGNNYNEIIKYETFVKPYLNLTISDKALNASRVSMSDVLRGKDIIVVVKELDKILSSLLIKKRKTGNNKPYLIGHNIAFDINFLSAAFTLAQKKFMDYFYPVPFDTQAMMKRKEAGKKLENGVRYNLTACCERNGIELLSAHGAMADVYATSDLFKLLDGGIRSEVGKGGLTGNFNGKKEKSRKFFEFCDIQ